MAESAQAESPPEELSQDIDAALRTGLVEGCLCCRVTARGWASFLGETLEIFQQVWSLTQFYCVDFSQSRSGVWKSAVSNNQGLFLDTFPPYQLISSWRFSRFFFGIWLEFFQDFARVLSFFTKNTPSLFWQQYLFNGIYELYDEL